MMASASARMHIIIRRRMVAGIGTARSAFEYAFLFDDAEVRLGAASPAFFPDRRESARGSQGLRHRRSDDLDRLLIDGSARACCPRRRCMNR